MAEVVIVTFHANALGHFASLTKFAFECGLERGRGIGHQDAVLWALGPGK